MAGTCLALFHIYSATRNVKAAVSLCQLLFGGFVRVCAAAGNTALAFYLLLAFVVDVARSVLEAVIYTYGSLGRIRDAQGAVVGPCDAACLRAITFACSATSQSTCLDRCNLSAPFK